MAEPRQDNHVGLTASLPTGVTTQRVLGTRVVQGQNAMRGLRSLVHHVAGAGPVAVITGRAARHATWAGEFAAELSETDATWYEVAPGLLTKESVDALRRASDRKDGAIVAAGGGSVLDAAKAVALMGMNHGIRVPPIIAVPTTAGTGSEVTSFATVWNVPARVKQSLDAPELRPAAAILDPRLPATCRQPTAAAAALDALSHSVEGTWSCRATPESQMLSLRALHRLAPAIDALSRDNRTDGTWEALSEGSMYAGAGIAMARTTAAHAVSYVLTLDHGLAHGHAAAVVLAPLLRFNMAVTSRDCVDPRGPAYVHRVCSEIVRALGCSDVESACDRIDGWIRTLGLVGRVELDVDCRALAARVVGNDRAANNPRVVTGDVLRQWFSPR